MIFDSDILIWIEHGNLAATGLAEADDERCLSVVSYLELMQGARDRREQESTRQFLQDFAFVVVPLSENIGHRATTYIEAYALSDGLGALDAIIAATAVEHGLTLCSGNAKHFRPIPGLKLKVFKP